MYSAIIFSVESERLKLMRSESKDMIENEAEHCMRKASGRKIAREESV